MYEDLFDKLNTLDQYDKKVRFIKGNAWFFLPVFKLYLGDRVVDFKLENRFSKENLWSLSDLLENIDTFLHCRDCDRARQWLYKHTITEKEFSILDSLFKRDCVALDVFLQEDLDKIFRGENLKAKPLVRDLKPASLGNEPTKKSTTSKKTPK